MNASLELKKDLYDQLVSACGSLKKQYADGTNITSDDTKKFVDILNQIFGDKVCVDFVFTENIDNILFGIFVNPTVTNMDLMNILVESDDMEFDRYMIEIDSKILSILDAAEIAAYIVEDISNIMYPNAIHQLRAYIDTILLAEDSAIDIRNSINYNAILIFAIKSTLYKISSLLYRLDNADMIGKNNYAAAFNYHDDLMIAVDKIKSNAFGTNIDVNKKDLSQLQWALMIYREMNREYKDAIYTLTTAKPLTGSRLLRNEIDKTVKALNRAANETITESTTFFNEARFSIFKSLKQNGLRSLEDAIFEIKVRIKNCNDPDDAMLIMRTINSNIMILEDYVENTPGISESEKERWLQDIQEYRNLRRELASKRFNKPTFFGIDYSQLDYLDRKRDIVTPNGYTPVDLI